MLVDTWNEECTKQDLTPPLKHLPTLLCSTHQNSDCLLFLPRMKSFINKPNLPVKLLVFVSTSVGIKLVRMKKVLFSLSCFSWKIFHENNSVELTTSGSSLHNILVTPVAYTDWSELSL